MKEKSWPFGLMRNLHIFFKDELTSRVMEHLRTKDRDSLLAEIHELRKTSTKPLKEQV